MKICDDCGGDVRAWLGLQQKIVTVFCERCLKPFEPEAAAALDGEWDKVSAERLNAESEAPNEA